MPGPLQTCDTRPYDGPQPAVGDVRATFLSWLFSFGVMRSIASGDRKALKRAPSLTVVRSDGLPAANLLEGADSRLSPEDRLIQQQETNEMKKKVLGVFEDDLVAQTLVEGMIDGMEGQELRELAGLSERDFATKRRLIRRRIDKVFPEGWKS